MEWFKFSWGHWMTGKIYREAPEAQSDFMTLVCLYCRENGNLTAEDARLECRYDSSYDRLLTKKIIKEDSGKLVIEFMDPQIEKQREISAKNSAKGKASGEARRSKTTNHGSTTVQQQLNRGSTTVQQGLNNCSTPVEQIEREREIYPQRYISNDTLSTTLIGELVANKKISLEDFLRSLPAGGPEEEKINKWWESQYKNPDIGFINFASSRSAQAKKNQEGIKEFTRQCRTIWPSLSEDQRKQYLKKLET